jgi:hypothetical protein
MNIKFKIIRFENQINRNEHIKIVGFNVLNEDDESSTIYHETILNQDEILNKSPEECVDLAFSKLSGSIASSVNKIKSYEGNLIGAYYIPS